MCAVADVPTSPSLLISVCCRCPSTNGIGTVGRCRVCLVAGKARQNLQNGGLLSSLEIGNSPPGSFDLHHHHHHHHHSTTRTETTVVLGRHFLFCSVPHPVSPHRYPQPSPVRGYSSETPALSAVLFPSVKYQTPSMVAKVGDQTRRQAEPWTILNGWVPGAVGDAAKATPGESGHGCPMLQRDPLHPASPLMFKPTSCRL